VEVSQYKEELESAKDRERELQNKLNEVMREKEELQQNYEDRILELEIDRDLGSDGSDKEVTKALNSEKACQTDSDMFVASTNDDVQEKVCQRCEELQHELETASTTQKTIQQQFMKEKKSLKETNQDLETQLVELKQILASKQDTVASDALVSRARHLEIEKKALQELVTEQQFQIFMLKNVQNSSDTSSLPRGSALDETSVNSFVNEEFGLDLPPLDDAIELPSQEDTSLSGIAGVPSQQAHSGDINNTRNSQSPTNGKPVHSLHKAELLSSKNQLLLSAKPKNARRKKLAVGVTNVASKVIATDKPEDVKTKALNKRKRVEIPPINTNILQYSTKESAVRKGGNIERSLDEGKDFDGLSLSNDERSHVQHSSSFSITPISAPVNARAPKRMKVQDSMSKFNMFLLFNLLIRD
jgi:hypothetical protein